MKEESYWPTGGRDRNEAWWSKDGSSEGGLVAEVNERLITRGRE